MWSWVWTSSVVWRCMYSGWTTRSTSCTGNIRQNGPEHWGSLPIDGKRTHSEKRRGCQSGTLLRVPLPPASFWFTHHKPRGDIREETMQLLRKVWCMDKTPAWACCFCSDTTILSFVPHKGTINNFGWYQVHILNQALLKHLRENFPSISPNSYWNHFLKFREKVAPLCFKFMKPWQCTSF